MTTRHDRSDAGAALEEQGFRADSVPQNWEALGAWLRGRGMVLGTDEARQFANGLANLNYLIRSMAVPWCSAGRRAGSWPRVPATWRASSGC
jgi:hypothetical protein